MSRTYHINEAHLQDGKLNWGDAGTALIDHYLWLPGTDIKAMAKLLYDTSGIYVRLEAIEKNIRAVYTGIYDMVCEDSCLEFFFSPMIGDQRYFNMEVNPNGAYYLGFGCNNKENVRLIVPNGTQLFQIKTYPTDNGWAVEYKIPVTFLQIFIPGFYLKRGLELRGNFYKCGDFAITPHYIAWNEIISDIPDFHRPDQFGKLIFN